MTDRRKYMAKRIGIFVVFLTAAVILILGFRRNRKKGDTSVFQNLFQETLLDQIGTTFFIFPYYVSSQEAQQGKTFLVRAVTEIFPLYGYVLIGEANEKDDLITQMQKENEKSVQEQKDLLIISKQKPSKEEEDDREPLTESQQEEDPVKQEETEEAYEEIQKEEQTEGVEEDTDTSDFIPVSEPVNPYDFSEEWNREKLISHFFAVDQNTALSEQYTDLNSLLYKDMSIDKNSDGPQILIYHTHSQEAFADSIPGDPTTTVVGAGERLAELLRGYGFQVMHHLGEYDVEKRDYAYNNSLPELEKLLEENPSIEVVIDLHRDEMDENTRLVTDIQGRPTARFMFFNGMSYLKGKGEISYLENPYIADNLAFSFQAQVIANEYYPGLTRRIYLKAYRYNMHLRPKSMLIELGAQNNTVEEIMNACDPLAHIISIVLNG